ncbi:DUF6220 domain-containing protein [Natronoglycomyces albus]|uniref:Uncharacterized protein n=1 Tax=Natronoglycomyces albus TaxID=2811108 RepID=A0A895XGT4_9ACTN|nr:DUF6220 domain-containing protein [Natronoglycomyces albus]QSB04107.1 hypothetical protein JQS30_09795 [Natronoglycomyces albus]
MPRVFATSVYALGWGVLIQFFLAGYAAAQFDVPFVSFSEHRNLGHILVALSLINLVLALLARGSRGTLGMAAAVFALMMVQMAIGRSNLGDNTVTHVMFGIHAINALVIMRVNMLLAKRAKRLIEDRAHRKRTSEVEEPVSI